MTSGRFRLRKFIRSMSTVSGRRTPWTLTTLSYIPSVCSWKTRRHGSIGRTSSATSSSTNTRTPITCSTCWRPPWRGSGRTSAWWAMTTSPFIASAALPLRISSPSSSSTRALGSSGWSRTTAPPRTSWTQPTPSSRTTKGARARSCGRRRGQGIRSACMWR